MTIVPTMILKRGEGREGKGREKSGRDGGKTDRQTSLLFAYPPFITTAVGGQRETCDRPYLVA
jgi:hypothetical protein